LGRVTQGSYPKGVYILRKGKIKIYQSNKFGNEQIVYIYKKGEVIGYRPIISDEFHPVSAAAIDDCIISFIPRNYFVSVLKESPILSNRLLMNLSHEFTVWTNKLSIFARQPVKERLALGLLILNEKYRHHGEKNSYSSINLSRIDLANYIGAAEETLVRMLQDFKRKGFIRIEGRKIVILNKKELEIISEIK
jgi:CRP-like cAMP-binding protein